MKNANDNKWKWKRGIICFNPPFSKRIKTNIGKIFLQLLSKHFPKNHKIRKIFNRNIVKTSYCCMKNFSSITSAHNRKILNPIIKSYRSNCSVKSSCTLTGKCLTQIISRADVSNDANNYKKFYFGLADTFFKEKYRNHTRDFKHKKYENINELVKYMSQLNVVTSILHQILSSIKSECKSQINYLPIMPYKKAYQIFQVYQIY